jgi:hypothetical protein
MNRKIIFITILGIIIGFMMGYAYYYYVGCAFGSCTITSKPLNSSLYGGLMGGLLFNLLVTSNKKKDK